jgi:hypothetical protein
VRGLTSTVIIPGMEVPPELQHNDHWRIAIWSLRVGYVALAVGLVGLVVTLSGSTPWVLAVGIITWLAAAVVTVTEVLRARHDLAERRPGLWPMRFMLIHETVRRTDAERR